MWIADSWKDYEVIDCSRGEKLERWGKYLLVRPDPQVIWDTPGSLTAETTKNPCRPHKAYIFLSNFFHFIVAIYGYMWYNKD